VRLASEDRRVGDDGVPVAALSLWRDRAFVLFWSGRIVSGAGTMITGVVLPILVFRLTGSAAQTALLTRLRAIPYLLLGLLAGALADRVDRRRVMVLCDALNAALLGSIPLAAVMHALTLAQIYLVALLSAAAFVLFDAASFGALPALVGRERIVVANSAIWSTSTVVELAAPAVGGILATTIGPAPAISLDALSYAASALTLLLIPRALSGTRTATAMAGSLVSRTLADIREGLRFVWGQPLVRTMTILGVGVSTTSGAVYGLLVVYGVRALGLSLHDARLGLLFTASALGALLATLLLPRLNRRYAPGPITLAGLILDLVCLLGLALAPTFATGLAALFLWDACTTLVVINGITLRQVVTPEHLQSRVNATARMIAWGGTPAGAIIGGVLAQTTTVRIALLVMADGIALSAAIGWFSPLRNRAAAGPAPACEDAAAT